MPIYSIKDLKNAHFTVTGPKQAIFYIFNEGEGSFEFTIDVQCDANNDMKTYRLLSTLCHDISRDTIRRENTSGVTLILKHRPMHNREADRIFGPIWNRYLEGYPFSNADFFIK